MELELGSLGVLTGTLVAVEQLYGVVQSTMTSEMSPAFELLSTDSTLVGCFSTVNSLMFLELSGQGELFEAYGTPERSFSGVPSKVSLQFVWLFEAL